MPKKVILITGCSSGFGYLTAELLAKNSYKVYAGVRKKKNLNVLARPTKGTPPTTILFDVTWPQEKIDNVIQEIIKKEKRIDVLVNNAGFGYLGAAGLFTEKDVREQFETNFFGLFKVTKAVLPFMRSKRSGMIINISSTAGLVTTSGYGIYSASKFSVEALSQALRIEESLFGIKVVSVNPGSFETKFWVNQKFPKPAGETQDSPLWRLTNRVKHLTNKRPTPRGNPNKVSRKIKEIIESKNPRKNYLIGWDAQLLYWGFRLLPNRLLDWLMKFVIKKLS